MVVSLPQNNKNNEYFRFAKFHPFCTCIIFGLLDFENLNCRTESASLHYDLRISKQFSTCRHSNDSRGEEGTASIWIEQGARCLKEVWYFFMCSASKCPQQELLRFRVLIRERIWQQIMHCFKIGASVGVKKLSRYAHKTGSCYPLPQEAVEHERSVG